MTNQERLRELQKSLDIDNILLAEAFIATNLKQLKLRKNTKIYVAAVDFIASKIKSGQSPLSKRDLTQLQKDEASKTVGSVHRKLKQEFENIIKLYAITIDADPPPSRQRIGERSPLPNPNPTGQPAAARKPEVELTSNEKRVEKGGSVILTWKSKHAVRVKRTNIPGVRSNQVNGTTVVDDIRRRRDFYIIVEGADKQTAEDKVVTLIETQRFLQGKDDPEPVVSNQRQRQTPSSSSRPSSSGGTQSTRVVSPSSPTPAVEEDKEPVIETRSNSLSNDILSSIDKSLENILKLLKSQLKLNETALVSVRRSTEEERRQAKEKEMEEGGLKEGLKIMKDAGKKILSPFKDIIDKIVRFIFFTFLGKAFTEIVKWFNDPENKDKVEAMGRFLKKFWPIIAGVAVLVLTPLGGLIVSIVKFFGGAIKTLRALGSIIKTIFKGGGKAVAPAATRAGARTATAAASRAGAAAASRAAARSGANVATGKSPNLLSKIATSGPLSKLTGKLLGKSAAKAIPFLGAIYGAIEGTSRLASGDVEGALLSYLGGVPVLGWGAVGLDAYRELDPEGYKKNIRAGMSIEEINKVLSDAFGDAGSAMVGGMGGTSLGSFASGGKIFSGLVGPNDGMKVSGAGKDTQMFPVAGGGAAILQPGEVVLQPKAVNKLLKLGIDPLALNEGPSANKPKTINSGNISLMNTGGVIGADQRRFIQRAIQRGITNPKELAAFMSQVHVEQGGIFSEPRRELYNTDPTDPPGKPGYRYFSKYANPDLGLGNLNEDDAYRYMGRGYLQITGRNNYADIGKRIGVDLLKNPELLKTDKDISMDAAIEYWKSRVRPTINNKWDDTFNVSRLVNNPSARSPSGIMHFNDRLRQSKFYSSLPPSVYKPQEQPKPKPQPNLLQQAGQFFGGIGDKIKGMFTPKKKKGGLVDYSSGEILQGRASDSILSRLEKGEYVIPKMAVALIGTDLLDRVSALDPNSEAYSKVSSTPFSKSSPQISTETLPPIMQGGYDAPSGGSGTPIPPIAPNASQEQAKAFNAAILGIV